MSTLSLSDFTEQVIECEEDYEGRVIATLLKSINNQPNQPSILYIHGFNDYFFQAHVANAFHEQNYNFYALDLRKYGRSLLSHQHPNYCRSVTEYYEEIDKSLQIIKEEYDTEITLLGHSTGGLINSLYLNEGQNRNLVDKLILNSPFFQFNMKPWQRAVILPLTGLISAISPYASQKKPFSHLYGTSISKQKKGEWDFNTDWKPLNGFPAYLKWVHAIYTGQKRLHKNSDIHKPILVLHSDKSSQNTTWDDEILKTDMVLNVEHMKYYGKELGPKVDLVEIPHAIHDIFLSTKEVRELAFEEVFNWLDAKGS
ncbi:MAG: alpha/beta hydrolase [Balneola sp.]|jgi:alpha-beta hydrolase superfamily lysophospholipase|nr:alpha/beta hydrolase [Balneola sp.]MBE80471.1 alpha/beta hydrolase [Balneola sp.]HBX67041.1 alpha/beta hydrolase [Balneolaceae bacterium]|tara:strand:- start:2516 stop:3454 length:939 start_codon:yes stop_codon:yes gene_type:complete